MAIAGQILLLQREDPRTLVPGLLLYALAGWLFVLSLSNRGDQDGRTDSPWTAQEGIALALILGLALFLRTFRLDDYPAGIDMDEAAQGWGGLMMARLHWNVFSHLSEVKVVQPGITSWASLWFHFFSPSRTHLFLFGSLLSLLAFPGIYFTFRQLAGPRTALLTLFLLAVSRWHFTFGRSAHPAMDFLIYMFGSLSLWIYGWKKGKRWIFLPAGLLLATGLYSYQAYFAFPPLLLFWFLYEMSDRKNPRPWPVRPLMPAFAAVFFAAMALGWPLLRFLPYMVQHGGFGPPAVKQTVLFHVDPNWEGLKGLAGHILQLALMYNRQGDAWVVHNLPLHRMLDDATGLLFALGLFLALTRFTERKYFYALSGLAFMSFFNFISADPTTASRLMGALPFALFLAALSLDLILDRIEKAVPDRGFPWSSLALALVLAFAALQNFYVYFWEQARNPQCRNLACLEETRVGEAILKDGDAYEYYLAPRFFGHYSVLYLGFLQRSHTHALRIPETIAPAVPPDRGICFALQEGQMGWLNLLQRVYPGGETEFSKDSSGKTIVYFYRIPARLAAQAAGAFTGTLKPDMGLTGIYRKSLDWKSPPLLIHRDPLVNFTFRNDFPLDPAPPFSVRWTGWLEIPQTGLYRFLVLTTDQAKVQIGSRKVLEPPAVESGDLLLKKGIQPLNVFFEKTRGVDTALSFLWKKPGSANYEVVPFTALKWER